MKAMYRRALRRLPLADTRKVSAATWPIGSTGSWRSNDADKQAGCNLGCSLLVCARGDQRVWSRITVCPDSLLRSASKHIRWLSTDFPIDVRKRCSLRLIVSTKSSTRFRSAPAWNGLPSMPEKSYTCSSPAPESAHAQGCVRHRRFRRESAVCVSRWSPRVKASIEKEIVTSFSISMDTIWWSTTSLSQRNTHRP